MYYNRFGRCNRGERCPYVHDPEKVAVCTRCAPTPRWAWGGGGPGPPWAPAPQTHPVCAGLSGAPARRQTGPAPSPTTSPRRR